MEWILAQPRRPDEHGAIAIVRNRRTVVASYFDPAGEAKKGFFFASDAIVAAKLLLLKRRREMIDDIRFILSKTLDDFRESKATLRSPSWGWRDGRYLSSSS